MPNDRIIAIADHYWAAHLGCPPAELFSGPLRLIAHGAELADYHGIFLVFRNDRAIVSVPPAHLESVGELLRAYSAGIDPARLEAALTPLAKRVIGPAYIGYANSVTDTGPSPASALTENDATAFDELRDACDPIEWEHGGSEIEHPCSAVRQDGRLVALAGYEVWGGTIAHISIVTRPGYRGRGYGRSAVAHLARRAITAGLLPQYRTLLSNAPSIRIAESLGFRSYATSLAIRL